MRNRRNLMIKKSGLMVVSLLLFASLSFAMGIATPNETRIHLIVLADMGCEPNEIQQMVHAHQELGYYFKSVPYDL